MMMKMRAHPDCILMLLSAALLASSFFAATESTAAAAAAAANEAAAATINFSVENLTDAATTTITASTATIAHVQTLMTKVVPTTYRDSHS
ncbi:hypothetical protein LINPERHAP1_LOCUS43317 [Linum perenne]